MAGDRSSEVYMRIMNNDGKGGKGAPVPAECATDISNDLDDLVLDYFDGEFFAVEDFRFGMNIEDTDSKSKGAKDGKDKPVHKAGVEKLAGHQPKFGKFKTATAAEINEWRKLTNKDNKPRPFQLRVDEFGITRRYDKASPVLFHHCAASIAFPSASIVKRKTIGDDSLGAYLRFDFKDLLITKISFEDSDEMKESIRFIFREMTVQYRPQGQDGKLGTATSPVTYKYDLQLSRESTQ
jgi:type VI protein secretion system component Hcp